MRLEFSRHIFEKYSDIICHENPSNDPRCFMRKGSHTDRQVEDNKRFS
jgi:hypothetical protein